MFRQQSGDLYYLVTSVKGDDKMKLYKNKYVFECDTVFDFLAIVS